MKKIAVLLSVLMNVFFVIMLFWFWTCIPKTSSSPTGTVDHAQTVDHASLSQPPSEALEESHTAKSPSPSQCSSWCQLPGKMLARATDWIKRTESMMNRMAQHWHTECAYGQSSSQPSITPMLASVV